MSDTYFPDRLDLQRLPPGAREYIREGEEAMRVNHLLWRYDALMQDQQHVLRAKFSPTERSIILQCLWGTMGEHICDKYVAWMVWDTTDKGDAALYGLTPETRQELYDRLCTLSLLDNSALMYAAADAESVFFREDVPMEAS